MRTTVPPLDDGRYEGTQEPSGRRLKRSVKGAARFPVFEVPANTRLIPASRVQKALDEDDIADLSGNFSGAAPSGGGRA
jgi:hypothetical protein